jgi:hypothetical protein
MRSRGATVEEPIDSLAEILAAVGARLVEDIGGLSHMLLVT